MNNSTASESDGSATSEGAATRQNERNLSGRRSDILNFILGLLSFILNSILGLLSLIRRRWIIAIVILAGVVAMVVAAKARDTIFVADAHTEIVRLERIDGSRTNVPVDGAMLCFRRGERPQWSALVEASKCGDLDAGAPPPMPSTLEIEDGARAIISRVGQGPLRVALSSVGGGQAGRIIGDGMSYSLPEFLFILLDGDGERASRIVTFRAAAEIGAPLESQRLLFGGVIEVQRSGAFMRDRFTARSETLRTGDALQFIRRDGTRAKVDGIVTFAPGEDGALRATIQAKGLGAERDEEDAELVHGAQISRIGSAPYTLGAGYLDNLLADPLFSYASGFLGIMAIVATILAVANDRKPPSNDGAT
jgi:hypothetical protein